MYLPVTLQQAVFDRLHCSLALANHSLNTSYLAPSISYQQRGTIAGSACLTDWEIRLNAVLLIENGQLFIDEVIPHELAHLLVHRQYGKVAPHGEQWRDMMERILQVRANRTHCFSVHSVRGKTVSYLCSCQQHQLGIRRHNRIVRDKIRYRCRCCGDPLTAQY